MDYFYNQGRTSISNPKSKKYDQRCLELTCRPVLLFLQIHRSWFYLTEKAFRFYSTVTKVEKKDLFTGTFMPSTELTGGYRVLSYLDPSEPKHAKLKQLMFYLLKSRRDHVIPEFNSGYTELFMSLEKNLALRGKASFETTLGLDGPGLVSKWVLFNLGPVLKLGLPKYLEDLTIHTFRLPPLLIKKSYQRLYDFFYASSGFLLDEAENLGISREEACHNLLFTTCFNSFGGMRIVFTNMMKWLGRAGTKLHARLAEEVRSEVRSNGGSITMRGMEQMPLMKSVVYEALRIEPPVSLQYGKAKRDLIIESHDAAFEVKEGEMLFGFQPFATKDPKIFTQAEEFVADRFVGEGEKLLKHVLWSNGPETEKPTLENKQCAGKDFVVLVSRLFLVELFLRYDSFEIEVASSPLGAAVTVTSLKRAKFLARKAIKNDYGGKGRLSCRKRNSNDEMRWDGTL
ncbi:allene oxide synthase family protein [Salix suchowensis]|nr:allene oxide synthase family protein [Salix suchowensis]